MSSEPFAGAILVTSPDTFWACFYLVAITLVLRRWRGGGEVIRLATYGYAILLAGTVAKLVVYAEMLERIAPRPRGTLSTRTDADPMGVVLFVAGIALLAGHIVLLRAVLRSGNRRGAA